MEEPVDAVISKRFHAHALGFGLTVGAFAQLSTMGYNFLVLSVLNEDFVKHHSAGMIVLLFFTSAVAIIMALIGALRFMRIIVSLEYQRGRGTRTATEDEDAAFQSIRITQLESLCRMWATLGECIYWTTPDLLLGADRHVTLSSITLMLGLMICYFFGFPADSKEVTESRDEEEDHSCEEQRYQSVQIV